MPTVQLCRREAFNFARFDDINAKHRDANVDQIVFYAVFYPAIEFVAAIASALIIWYGGDFVLRGSLTLGSLVAFLLYSGRFFRPISDMSEKFNTLQAAAWHLQSGSFSAYDHQIQIGSRFELRGASGPQPGTLSPHPGALSPEPGACARSVRVTSSSTM